MLFEQNIASNAFKCNQKPGVQTFNKSNHKHKIMGNHAEPRGITWNQSEQLLGTYSNLLNLKNMKCLLLKTSYKKKKNKVGFRFASND